MSATSKERMNSQIGRLPRLAGASGPAGKPRYRGVAIEAPIRAGAEPQREQDEDRWELEHLADQRRGHDQGDD
jgi:hypothetical protein